MANEREQGIASAVDALRQSYEVNAKAMREIGDVMDRRFGRQRLWMAVLAAVLALALVMGWGFRQADHERTQDERERVSAQREDLIRGCERGNDQRATLRTVISEAYEPTPISPSLSPELAELLRQSQERARIRRDALLTLPGVQPVDCRSAYSTEEP